MSDQMTPEQIADHFARLSRIDREYVLELVAMRLATPAVDGDCCCATITSQRQPFAPWKSARRRR